MPSSQKTNKCLVNYTQNPNHATINQSNTQSLKTEIILAKPIKLALLR